MATRSNPSVPVRVKPRILSGFRDMLPEQALLRQSIVSRFRSIFESHGYEPIETPVLEYLDVLTGKAGENERLMYHFLDQGERHVGMRYDLTVPLARVMAMHQNDLVLPFKRYHIAPVWRADRPQRGRFREFWQCDADIAGSGSMQADAEGVAILNEAMAAVGIPNFTIRINHRAVLSALARNAGGDAVDVAEVIRAIDRLDKIGAGKVEEQLVGLGVRPEQASALLALLTDRAPTDAVFAKLDEQLGGTGASAEAVGDLRTLFALIADLGVPEGRARLDLSLARGIDYYTGPIVEVAVTEPAIGSLGGGGRYDGLVNTFSSRPMPATGVSIGIERVFEVVAEFNLLRAPKTTASAFVVVFHDDVVDAAGLASRLRLAGIPTDLSLLGDRSVGEQLRYAGRKGIPFAVISGEDERREGTVTVKDLVSGDQSSMTFEDAVALIRNAATTEKEQA